MTAGGRPPSSHFAVTANSSVYDIRGEARAELLTIAQVAATLIGFSGLIAVFRISLTGHWARRDVTGAAIVTYTGGMGLLYSLLPFVFVHAGMANGIMWTVTSLVFSIGLFAGVTIFVVVNRHLRDAGHPERMPRLNRLAVILAATFGLVLIVNAFWVAAPRRPAAYIAALVFLLVVPACYMAVRLWQLGQTDHQA